MAAMTRTPTPAVVQAVLWDFGGVFTTSPFEAFNRYEAELGLPRDFIRRVNSRNPHDNAWARMERGEIGVDEFVRDFEAEARALGAELAGGGGGPGLPAALQALSGHRVIELLGGALRPEMVQALERVRQRHRVACITNNMPTGHGPAMVFGSARAAELARVFALFELVVESSKLGLRKPDPRIYRHAVDRLGVAPEACVYLDDLGINCKPAREMGMRTIKVENAAQAIGELEQVLGLALR
jgi:putative hydrolase of the HAD superfamily